MCCLFEHFFKQRYLRLNTPPLLNSYKIMVHIPAIVLSVGPSVVHGIECYTCEALSSSSDVDCSDPEHYYKVKCPEHTQCMRETTYGSKRIGN